MGTGASLAHVQVGTHCVPVGCIDDMSAAQDMPGAAQTACDDGGERAQPSSVEITANMVQERTERAPCSDGTRMVINRRSC